VKISKQKAKLLIIVTCLIFLTLSMPFVQALTTPIPNQLVVRLDDSQAVTEAIENLEQNIPNAVVVDYDSAKYNLKYWRFLGVAIWVSHGSEEGVMINGELTQWDVLEDPIKGTPNKDIVLSCYSSALLEQTDLSSTNVATFDGEIDAVIGSLVVSYILSQDSSIYPKIKSRFMDIFANPSCVEPLRFLLDPGGGGGIGGTNPGSAPNYARHYLSWAELGFHLVAAFLLIALFLVDWYIPSDLPFVVSMQVKIYTVGWASMVTTLVYLGLEKITLESAIGTFMGWFLDALEIFWDCFFAAELWEQIVFGITGFIALFVLAIELAGDAASGGAVTVAKILGAAVAITCAVVSFMGDYRDTDTIVG